MRERSSLWGRIGTLNDLTTKRGVRFRIAVCASCGAHRLPKKNCNLARLRRCVARGVRGGDHTGSGLTGLEWRLIRADFRARQCCAVGMHVLEVCVRAWRAQKLERKVGRNTAVEVRVRVCGQGAAARTVQCARRSVSCWGRKAGVGDLCADEED